jgi:ABC-type transport system involved in cytochrome c biogenesis permease component
MNAFLQQLRISLKLHYRNKMALIYSYLFPLIFLLAFWVLYRHERVTLARHLGELLTVSVLGGACFGLPTTMVSERERGVWRRYRLTPVSTAALVASTAVARYCILISAGLLQLGLALALGMPLPKHPVDLFIVFTFVSFAFIGLGLVMAMMADNVPAVQALGQCIFLPMLIIGGIAVPLASLPDWAQHVSAFFPGRYAVEAFQACVIGTGLGAARFNLIALLIIGAGGCVAGAKMFRWDAQQRFAARSGKGWISVALLSWGVVGVMSEYQGRILAINSAGSTNQAQAPPATTPALPAETPPPAATQVQEPSPPAPVTLSAAEKKTVRTDAARKTATTPAAPAPAPETSPAKTPPPHEAPPVKTPPLPSATPASWQAVTMADIDRDLVFDRLPSDSGIVTPIAPDDEEPDPDTADHLQYIREMLPSWQPGKVADPVQRVRNILYVAAEPDVLQMPIERFAPQAVYERLQQDIPKDQLIKVLYWIALHPTDGDDKALDELWALRFPNGAVDVEQTRERAAIYAVKLLGRLLGKLPRRPS